jgi:hypothetical protein
MKQKTNKSTVDNKSETLKKFTFKKQKTQYAPEPLEKPVDSSVQEKISNVSHKKAKKEILEDALVI